MTPEQILLVQASFDMAGSDGAALARSLRARLQMRDPTPGRLRSEPACSRPLAGLLVLAIRGLSRRHLLRPALRRLGARHLPEGCDRLQDRRVASALLEALEDVLGISLPLAVAEAWQAWHRMASSMLREGAGQAAAA
jgi:hypothetical protein